MKAERKETMIRNWYKFSSGGVSVIGLAIVVLIIVLAIFAPVIAPYPQDVGAVVNFEESSLAPSMELSLIHILVLLIVVLEIYSFAVLCGFLNWDAVI